MNVTIADDVEVLVYHAIEGECLESIEETAKLCLDVAAETYGKDSEEYTSEHAMWTAILGSDACAELRAIQIDMLANWASDGPICVDTHAELESRMFAIMRTVEMEAATRAHNAENA